MVLAEHVEPVVWHCDSRLVRVDRAKRKILGRNGGLGEHVKKGRLAHVWQSDDADFEIGPHPAQNLGGGLFDDLFLWWHKEKI